MAMKIGLVIGLVLQLSPQQDQIRLLIRIEFKTRSMNCTLRGALYDY